MEEKLVQAKQMASQAKGLNFYVTKSGIKRDFNLFGGDYEYKVYYKKGIIVEDSKGKRIKEAKDSTKAAETKVSPKLQDAVDVETNGDAKRK